MTGIYKAFNIIKKDPNKETYYIEHNGLDFVIKIKQKDNYFSAWESQKLKKLYISIRNWLNNDIILKRFLYHEINHALDWWNINKENFENGNFMFNPLPGEYKKMNKVHKINNEEIKASPLFFMIYTLSDSEMKSKLHEFYSLLENEIGNKKLSNEEIKKIFLEKLNIFRSVNYNFIKKQLNVFKESIPDDFDENTVLYLGISERKCMVGYEVAQYFGKEHVNKNDFDKLYRIINKKIDILKSKVIKIISNFI